MVLGPVLVLALGMLAIYGVYTTRTLVGTEALPAPAPTAVDGALRIARTRLVRGEIDPVDYERIRSVLCG